MIPKQSESNNRRRNTLATLSKMAMGGKNSNSPVHFPNEVDHSTCTLTCVSSVAGKTMNFERLNSMSPRKVKGAGLE